MDSNHVLRIFSPAHTPCLPSVHIYLPSVDELKVDAAKLDRPDASYLRTTKIFEKNFSEPQKFVILPLPYLLTPQIPYPLTLQKWLIERRLEKAAELLSEGMSVIDTYIQEKLLFKLEITAHCIDRGIVCADT